MYNEVFRSKPPEGLLTGLSAFAGPLSLHRTFYVLGLLLMGITLLTVQGLRQQCWNGQREVLLHR